MKLCPACEERYGDDARACPRDGATLVQVPGPVAARDVDPLCGQVLDGRYRIERRLGAGGMGAVYVGRQQAVDRAVAVKVLPAALGSDEEAVRRFLQEARASSALAHPNIVTIHDFGQTADGLLYLVMELVPGETLTRVLARSGALPAARAAEIGRQILDALEEAHGRGIVHRDLKSDNVMVCSRAGNADLVKVLDFGLARVAGSSSGMTRTGAVLGTPSYMSPEQAHGDRTDHRTDLYSLGVILYELLAGRLPFEAELPLAVLIKHMHEAPPPLEGVPSVVAAVVLRALAKSPAERFASAAEMNAALAAAVGRPVAASGPPDAADFATALTVPPSSPSISGLGFRGESVPPPRREPQRLRALAAAVLLLAGAAVAWQVFTSGEASPTAVAQPRAETPPSEAPASAAPRSDALPPPPPAPAPRSEVAAAPASVQEPPRPAPATTPARPGNAAPAPRPRALAVPSSAAPASAADQDFNDFK
jgi:serine/threonine-protein kinase